MGKTIMSILTFLLLVACSPQTTIPTQETSAAIFWQRSGGIAGICHRLTISQDESYELVDCVDESLITEGTLSPEQEDQVSMILEQYGQFQYTFVPPEGTADMFSDELRVLGTGNETPTQEEQAAISEQLAQLASELALPQE